MDAGHSTGSERQAAHDRLQCELEKRVSRKNVTISDAAVKGQTVSIVVTMKSAVADGEKWEYEQKKQKNTVDRLLTGAVAYFCVWHAKTDGGSKQQKDILLQCND